MQLYTRKIVTRSFITAPRKRTPPHCQGPTPTRFSATAHRWNTRPNSGKICLRFLAQGADHEMSADWLAAGPRGRKNPEPGQQNSLFVFSSSLSSPTLLRLSSPASAPSSSYSTSGRAGTSSFLAVLLRKVSSGGSTHLRVLLLHFPAACSQRQFFFSRLLVVSAILPSPATEVSWAPSLLQVSPAAYRQRRHVSSLINYLLSTFLVSCVRGLGSWVVFLCLLSLLSSFHDRLTFHVRPAIFTNGAQRGARTHDPEIKSLMLYRLS